MTFRYSCICFICLWLHRLVKHPHDVEQTYNDDHHHWNGEMYESLNYTTFCLSFSYENINTELNIKWVGDLWIYCGWFWIHHMYCQLIFLKSNMSSYFTFSGLRLEWLDTWNVLCHLWRWSQRKSQIQGDGSIVWRSSMRGCFIPYRALHQ